MLVFTAHNAYRVFGGEDVVYQAECELLKVKGHEVVTYHVTNEDIGGGLRQVAVAPGVVWSSRSKRAIGRLLREHRPDVAHFHNTFPLISPAAYWACAEAGVPVVQTLHNYRLVCPNAMLMYGGQVCDGHPGRARLIRCVLRGCYHDSRAQTAVVAAMLAVHRFLGTWQEKVDAYVALTEFARARLIEMGLPREKVFVKPNFVHPDPGARERNGQARYALFVGRLSPEKGVETLLRAWHRLPRVPLKVVGGGPLEARMRRLVSEGRMENVELLGQRPREEALACVKEAAFLVFPSEWYEGFPMTIVEAFACGVPVLASGLGSAGEIVEEGRTGLHFAPGDAEDLAAKAEWAWAHPQAMAEMGRQARREYEAKYTAEKNYRILMEIYAQATARRFR